MDILIIDDGINENRFNIGSLECNLEIDESLIIKERTDYDANAGSHGTYCAAVIKLYAPDAKLGSLKILSSDTARANKNQLLKALNWCAEQSVGLIHMSIGTAVFADFPEVKEAVFRLYENGKLIVAAYDNRNIYTLPAGLSCVIGVQQNPGFEGEKFTYISKPGLNTIVHASGRHELNDNGTTRTTPASNSYAAPLITAKVFQLYKSRGLRDTYEILEALQQSQGYLPCTPLPSFFPILFDFCQSEGDAKNGRIFTLSKLWEEKTYIASMASHEKPLPIPEIEIPCVFIYGKKEEIAPITLNLAAVFAGNGYYAKTAGQFPCAYLYGLEYIDKTANRAKILNTIADTFDCDLILCAVDLSETDGEFEVDADVTVLVDTENKLQRNSNPNFIHVANYDEQLCKNLYDRIVGMLDTENSD